jgi:TPR repeat protein
LLLCIVIAAAVALRNTQFDSATTALKADDFGSARARYQRLALFGDRRAQVMLAYVHAYGWGVPRNHEVALQWLERAGRWGFGERVDVARTAYHMGLDLATGVGAITRDEAESAYWLGVAAEHGSSEAARRLQGRSSEKRDGLIERADKGDPGPDKP